VARLPRYAAPGMPQHVIQRGNNRSPTFLSESDYRYYLECLEEACRRWYCQVHAYVLMTNHVHLLLTPTTNDGVSRVMQTVGRRVVQRFNKAHARTGTLWEGRYKATIVEDDRYLFTCYRYIELNPVRAGLVVWPRDYRWSSHAANALGRRSSLVVPHAKYNDLGPDPVSRRAAYRALFAELLTDTDLETIREATNKGWALGGERFRDAVERSLNRRAQPKWVATYRAGLRSNDHERL
jgi:putative transposase